jgi:hypothetical protein
MSHKISSKNENPEKEIEIGMNNSLSHRKKEGSKLES